MPASAAINRMNEEGLQMAKTTMASETIESKNKAFVLEAFDTLFNKRDYAAAERFWSPNYIQHSAHIAQVAKGYSISSAQCRKRCAMRTSSSLQKAITS